MKIAITGSSGLIGTALTSALNTKGHFVIPMVRGNQSQPDTIAYDYHHRTIEKEKLATCHCLIHLAGRPIADGRWTQKVKQDIRESRVQSTRFLAETLAELKEEGAGPKALINASAIGYYGNRGDTELHEDAGPGENFLAEVCSAWEQATEPAREASIRVAIARIGVVLARDGGALKKMLLPFKLGIGGRLGDGQQYMPWIHLDDLVSALVWLVEKEDASGPYNCTAPEPVRNAAFTKTLATVLKRPAFLPAPAFALRLALGEMADQLLLASVNVVPSHLQQEGFSFQHGNLKVALKDLID